MVQRVKNPPAMHETQGMQVQSLGQEDPLRRKWQFTPVFLPGNPMDRRAWRTTMGSQRAGHNWVTNTFIFTPFRRDRARSGWYGRRLLPSGLHWNCTVSVRNSPTNKTPKTPTGPSSLLYDHHRHSTHFFYFPLEYKLHEGRFGAVEFPGPWHSTWLELTLHNHLSNEWINVLNKWMVIRSLGLSLPVPWEQALGRRALCLQNQSLSRMWIWLCSYWFIPLPIFHPSVGWALSLF